MLVHVAFNFDDVLFPVSVVSKFFSAEKDEFVVPQPVRDQIHQLDTMIANFIANNLVNTRFRVLTHSQPVWIYKCLALMPILLRFVKWRYVDLVFYEGTTRHACLNDLLARDNPYEMYLFAGYSLDEETAIPESILSCLLRFLVFVRKPTLGTMLYEWERMPVIFNGFLTRKDPVIRNHFVVSDDCQQRYGAPGWYASPRLLPQIPEEYCGAKKCPVSPPGGPTSPSGTFPIHSPQSPPKITKTGSPVSPFQLK